MNKISKKLGLNMNVNLLIKYYEMMPKIYYEYIESLSEPTEREAFFSTTFFCYRQAWET